MNLICPVCSRCFEKKPWEITKKMKRNPLAKIYCSPTCYRKDRWGGETQISLKCLFCKKHLIKERWEVKRCKFGHFCSRLCYGKWRSENFVGEHSPLWKGGKDKRGLVVWKNARLLAKKRDDNTCRICGKTGKKLDVHHIVPLDLFDDISEAHNLDNLITLCRKCHSSQHELTEKQKMALELGRKLSSSFKDLL